MAHSAAEDEANKRTDAPPAVTACTSCAQTAQGDPGKQEPDDDQAKQAEKQRLRDSAEKPDRGGLTKAGRALAKHGQRPGSAFPQPSGGPDAINQQGKAVVDDILDNPGSRTTAQSTGRFGDTLEVRAPDGRGLRYSNDGNEFIGFLEP